MDYQLAKLKNGITLLKVPIKDIDSVVVNFFVKTGSRNEPEKLRGISHFLEHLLFKGTKKYPTAKILSTTVESIGAEYNAATSKEYTVFYIKAAADYLPLIFEVLSDMLFHPLLDPQEIQREKGVIIEEMNMYRDSPARYVPDLLEELMWPRSDLGAQIIGSEQTINKMLPRDITNYLASTYNNANLTVAVGGKYNEKQLNQLVKKYLDSGRSSQSAKHTSALASGRNPQAIMHYKKTEQAHLALGFYGFDFNHAQNTALQVLCNVLGGGMSSRLFSEVRERRGLAYYIHMSSSHYQDTGLVSVNAGLRLNKVEEALRVVAEQLKLIKKEKVSAAELKKAKDNLKGRIVLSLEDSESRLDWYLEQVIFRKKIYSPKEYLGKIGRVNAAELRDLANKLFQRPKMRLALISPYKNLEKKYLNLLQV